MKDTNAEFDKLNTTLDIFILMGDFNVEPEEDNMSVFLNICSLKNHLKQKA